MARTSHIVLQAGHRLGLGQSKTSSIAYGDPGGFLVQLAPFKDAHQGESVLALIRYGDQDGHDALREALRAADLSTVGIKPKDLNVDDGAVTFKLHRGFVGGPRVDSVVQAFETVFDIVKTEVTPTPRACRSCGEPYEKSPVLINGVVERMCATCIDRLHQAAEDVRASYDAAPVNLVRAIVVASVLAVVGAVAWAAIAVATNSMFWLAAIGMGALIGLGTTKAAGRGATIVQVISGVCTVASVLLGQLMSYGYYVWQDAQQEEYVVDWLAFLKFAPEILIESGGDTVFALGGGLLGAYYAAKMASKRKLELTVDA